MTDLFEILPLLQKNIDTNEAAWNSLGGKVYTQILQWVSDLQDWNTADVLVVADCVYFMEVSVSTIITVEYKIRKYIGHYVSFLSNLNLLLVCTALQDSCFFVPECQVL
jgi:hypothetical protein